MNYKAVPENKSRGAALGRKWYVENKLYKSKYDEVKRNGYYFNKNIWEKWVSEGSDESSYLLKLNPNGLKIQRREYG